MWMAGNLLKRLQRKKIAHPSDSLADPPTAHVGGAFSQRKRKHLSFDKQAVGTLGPWLETP